ncbi:MAG TPA: Ig-like domain-containing protein, partial [Chloroflexia bacterium]|nr:Ig-like domain-containing protein [Chloroflexia bacterium]
PSTVSGNAYFSIDGGGLIILPLSNGVISYTTDTLSVGSHTVSATFGGSDTYGYSSSSLTQVVNPNCDPLVVTSITDDGSGSTCGTLSYALNQPLNSPDGQTITFALSQGETVTFTGSLGIKVKTNVTIKGGTFGSNSRVTLDGNGVSGDGLTLTGNDTLLNLTIKNFGGKELVLEGTGNKLQGVCVKAG